ncbi:MAG: DUF2974 domain-containing protein [Rhodocyclaceae bacterium]|nr:DUF2974 domain-containing protein [Rhodocyclaceae bacterium]MBK9623032.1 DUF2974 domain-containing protein [Rhodocyclaceae bacterium]MBL0075588.1 DUF2974 domain-containing protein [Rhodocyclaceae bacterium]MBP6109436.1 DUF2974 domain-containing protein [Rhodocyclaceae bacterium]MBP6279119.1 DUF2974 domain-containing protein [Rhodocyclaceae bacterium]
MAESTHETETNTRPQASLAARAKRAALRGLLVILLLLALTLLLPTSYVMYLLHASVPEVAVGRESIWCNERYLPKLDARGAVINSLHQTVAAKGYLYALLGAYALQQDNREGQEHFFELPARAKSLPQLHQHDADSGFEASSFEIADTVNPKHLREIVIAFTGSNDDADWRTNFSLDKTQYDQAVAYVQRISTKYPEVPIAVTGYSLGGALAVHVTKNAATAHLIYAAWVFNPSPKTWADSSINPKIWQASTSDDILKFARLRIFRFLPGVAAIGAPVNQRAENYYLIESNPVHAHFRWALARNILHSADLALWKLSNGEVGSSEPLEILQKSRFKACPKS